LLHLLWLILFYQERFNIFLNILDNKNAGVGRPTFAAVLTGGLAAQLLLIGA